MNKRWDDKAWEDYLAWSEQNKKVWKKINALVKDIERNGAAIGIGKPEPLKHQLSGFWSRRIDEANRLIYQIDEHGFLYIADCKGHYE